MKKSTYEFIDPDEQINSPDFRFIEGFLKATGRTQIGWHYITDITWLYSKIKHWPRNYKILDVGGGIGALQFLLAEIGFNVTNIDLVLSKPLLDYKKRYGTRFQELPSFTTTEYAGHIKPKEKMIALVRSSSFYRALKSTPAKYESRHEAWRRSAGLSEQPLGTIQHIRGNICAVPEFAAGTFDAVVSLSALEHIPLEGLSKAVGEIHRILKPDAACAMTTSGTEKSETWFHEASQGHCFSALDLERYFGIKPDGYQNPSEIIEKYRKCRYLQDNLADFYKESDKYGMPWGIWDPKYIPVGICSKR